MPELPEVETVRRGLEPHLLGQRITKIETMRADVRRPFPPHLAASLEGATVIRVGRRAKYLLLDTDRGQTTLVHLGMSGKLLLRPARPNALDKHDHLLMSLASGQVLVFNDARRFGLWELAETEHLDEHPLLSHLGPEPLSADFDADYLQAALAKRSGPLKPVLMDQALVVGVGNIYAAEALFRARLHPQLPAHTLGKLQVRILVPAIRQVLEEAIESGGSTLRDYVRSDGDAGYFQHHFAVYGRTGKPCTRCATPVEQIVQAGRSTFFCPNCQKATGGKKLPPKAKRPAASGK